VIAAMLLLLDKMLRLFDFVAAEGGPVSVVWRMLANLIPNICRWASRSVCLLGILLAFRSWQPPLKSTFSGRSGKAIGGCCGCPISIAIALALVNFAIVGWVQPTSRYLYEELRFDLRSGALGASIKVGEFNNLGDNLTVRIEESRNQGNDLSGLFVFAENKKGQSISVTAEKGQFLRTDDPDTIILRLTNGTLVHDAPNYRNAACPQLFQP
jgi:lipopolysaccharide export system permease protein